MSELAGGETDRLYRNIKDWVTFERGIEAHFVKAVITTCGRLLPAPEDQRELVTFMHYDTRVSGMDP